MKKFKVIAIPALAALSLLIAGFSGDGSGGNTLVVDEMFVLTTANCTPPGPDNGAFALQGTKLPPGGLTYRINSKTFPAGLNALEATVAIHAAFATWDFATPATLFAPGTTTTTTPGAGDGISTVGFGKIKGSAVAVTYGWFNRKTKLLTEFDIVLSNTQTWATNPFGIGNCGGSAGAFDIGNILTHEVGHAVGLADLTLATNNAQTMFGYVSYGELTKRTLGDGDLKGVTALYGP